MEPTDLRDGHHAPQLGRMHLAWLGTVVVERLVWPRGVVVGEIRAQEAAHLRRLLSEYLIYYHGARTHLSVEKDAPEPRPVERLDEGRIVETPMVGGLHHRYTRQAA
jgi:putative transposase